MLKQTVCSGILAIHLDIIGGMWDYIAFSLILNWNARILLGLRYHRLCNNRPT
jgi:hypothetical protein